MKKPTKVMLRVLYLLSKGWTVNHLSGGFKGPTINLVPPKEVNERMVKVACSTFDAMQERGLLTKKEALSHGFYTKSQYVASKEGRSLAPSEDPRGTTTVTLYGFDMLRDIMVAVEVVETDKMYICKQGSFGGMRGLGHNSRCMKDDPWAFLTKDQAIEAERDHHTKTFNKKQASLVRAIGDWKSFEESLYKE